MTREENNEDDVGQEKTEKTETKPGKWKRKKKWIYSKHSRKINNDKIEEEIKKLKRNK